MYNSLLNISKCFTHVHIHQKEQVAVEITNTQQKPPQQLVNKLQQVCQFHQVATSLLKSACCNLSFADLLQLVKQLAANLWITKFENEFAPSLLTTCNRLVVIKLS